MSLVERTIRNAIKTTMDALVSNDDLNAVAYDLRARDIMQGAPTSQAIDAVVQINSPEHTGGIGFEIFQMRVDIGIFYRDDADIDSAVKATLEAAIDAAQIAIDAAMMTMESTYSSSIQMVDRVELDYEVKQDSELVNESQNVFSFMIEYHTSSTNLETAI